MECNRKIEEQASSTPTFQLLIRILKYLFHKSHTEIGYVAYNSQSLVAIPTTITFYNSTDLSIIDYFVLFKDTPIGDPRIE